MIPIKIISRFLALGLLAFGALTPAQAQLRETALVVEIQTPIVVNGKQVGTMKLPVGTKVTVVSEQPDGFLVTRGGGAPFKIAKAAIPAAPAPEPASSPVPDAPEAAPAGEPVKSEAGPAIPAASATPAPAAASANAPAKSTIPSISPAQVLKEIGLNVGLVICVGTGDGSLETSIAEAGKGNVLVQGVSADPKAAAAARERIAKAGWTGYASVATVPNYQNLPYNDHLANLVIADLDAPGAPTFEEVQRVVHPFGSSLVRRKGVWEKTVKPLPPTMDEWTHYDHGPEGNPQSSDSLVGPVSGLQYMVSGHGDSSSSLRLAGGLRLQGVRRSGSYVGWPSTYQSRDAFNGLPQWRVDMTERYKILATSQDRNTAADAARIVGVWTIPGPAEVRDSRTGEQLVVLKEGLNTREKEKGEKNPIEMQNVLIGDTIVQSFGPDVVGLDAKTGKRLWAWKAPEGEVPAYLAVGGGSVYIAISKDPTRTKATYQNAATKINGVVALDLAKGTVKWTSREADGFYSFGMVLAGDAVYLVDTNPKPHAITKEMSWSNREYGDLLALKTSDGSVLWRRSLTGVEPEDTFWHNKLRVQDGFVQPTFQKVVRGFDAKTGKDGPVLFRMTSDESAANKLVFCSVGRGSANGQVGGKFARFVDYKTGKWYNDTIARGICDEGQFPAYGQIHTGVDLCGCTSYLRGMVGLQSAQDTSAKPIPEVERVERGVAFELLPATTGDWGFFRGDVKRSSASATPLAVSSSAKVSATATVPLAKNVGPIGLEWSESNLRNGNITPAVVAGDLLVTASVDAQTVNAFDATTGKPRWTWQAGARVTSSPTITRGLVLFGSNDGYVTALRAADGAMVWRRFVAPNRRQIVVDGQLESLWPAFGSVTVLGDQAFVVAGRHNQCDGGVRISRLDLKTGALQAETTLHDSDTSETPKGTDTARGDGDGRGADVLSLNMANNILVMNNILIDPATLAWSQVPHHRNIDEVKKGKRPPRIFKSGPAWTYEDKSLLATISAPAAGMFDKRASTSGQKGQAGYRFMAQSPYQNGYVASQLAIDGRTMFAVDRGKIIQIKMGDDWMPLAADPKKYVGAGEDFVGAGDGVFALLTTPKQVVLGRVDKMGAPKSTVTIYDRATKAKVSETNFPARIAANGLAAAGGRLYVTLENGEVAIIGG